MRHSMSLTMTHLGELALRIACVGSSLSYLGAPGHCLYTCLVVSAWWDCGEIVFGDGVATVFG